ncbi:MAG: 30S ribosomal protein S6 [Patescibacteria group bacterium]
MNIEDLEIELKDYEVSFLGLTENTAQEVADILAKYKARVLVAGPVKQIELAYTIKKHKTAFFAYFQFQSLPEAIKPLSDELSMKTDISRFLVVTPPIKKAIERNREKPFDATQDKSKETEPRAEEKISRAPEILSNELLEQKLEEILQ